jgi:hypothetical protein
MTPMKGQGPCPHLLAIEVALPTMLKRKTAKEDISPVIGQKVIRILVEKVIIKEDGNLLEIENTETNTAGTIPIIIITRDIPMAIQGKGDLKTAITIDKDRAQEVVRFCSSKLYFSKKKCWFTLKGFQSRVMRSSLLCCKVDYKCHNNNEYEDPSNYHAHPLSISFLKFYCALEFLYTSLGVLDGIIDVDGDLVHHFTLSG